MEEEFDADFLDLLVDDHLNYTYCMHMLGKNHPVPESRVGSIFCKFDFKCSLNPKESAEQCIWKHKNYNLNNAYKG